MSRPAQFLFLLILMVSTSSASFAYESWRTITSTNEAFSMEVPSDFEEAEKRIGVDGFRIYTAEGDSSRFTVFEGSQLNSENDFENYVGKHIKEMKSKGIIASDVLKAEGEGWTGKRIDFKYGAEHTYMSTLIALCRPGKVVYLVNVNSIDPQSSVNAKDAARAFKSFTVNPKVARAQQKLKNANNLGYTIGYYGPILIIFLFVFTIFGLLIFLLKRD